MRVRRTPAALTAVVAAMLGPALLGSTSAAAATSWRIVADWELNEPSGASTMVDASGHGLDGRIGREVGTDVHVSGATGYRFSRLDPDTPPTHPQHLATVSDDNRLDPGTRD